jgi:hypothetical protein
MVKRILGRLLFAAVVVGLALVSMSCATAFIPVAAEGEGGEHGFF